MMEKEGGGGASMKKRAGRDRRVRRERGKKEDRNLSSRSPTCKNRSSTVGAAEASTQRLPSSQESRRCRTGAIVLAQPPGVGQF